MTILVALAGCPPTASNYTGPRGGEVYEPGEKWVYAPQRSYVVSEFAAVDGLKVAARPYAITGWEIAIRNETADAIAIHWDASTAVSSAGESLGRMIRGKTRRMDAEKQQPATPIAPGAKHVERVFLEEWIPIEEYENEWIGKTLPTAQYRKLEKMRKGTTEATIGAKLHLSVEIGGAKKTWTGIVEGVGVE